MTRRTKRGKIPKPYDSWLEYDLHQGQLSGCDFHTETIDYVQHRSYEPDFVTQQGHIKVYIEVKGRFRDRPEARKYVDVIKSLDPVLERLVFVFADSHKPMPGSQRRKDGTRFSHGDWAEKHGITYYDLSNCPNLSKRKKKS